MNNDSVLNINAPRDFLPDSFGDNKINKSMELNSSMSIAAEGADEYEQRIRNLGGFSSNG